MTRVLAVIPARGGSKGLPRKGLATVAGKTLIQRAFESAAGVASISKTVLSTDDKEYVTHARSIGLSVPFMRPEALATDTATSIDVFVHALGACENADKTQYDVIVVLQPTSPFRTSNHVSKALDLFLEREADQLVSVCAWEHPLAWSVVMNANGKISPDTRLTARDLTKGRQEFDLDLRLNGAIYCYRRDFLLSHPTALSDRCIGFEMPMLASVDIDTADDLSLANAMAKVHASTEFE